MDGKNILEIYDTGGKMQKAMHKNEVVWRPDKRTPKLVTIIYQNVPLTSREYPPLPEETMRTCLTEPNFVVFHSDGSNHARDIRPLAIRSKQLFEEVCVPGEIVIIGLTAPSLNQMIVQNAANAGVLSYHIFEDTIRTDIDAELYKKHIQPLKDQLAPDDIRRIFDDMKASRKTAKGKL